MLLCFKLWDKPLGRRPSTFSHAPAPVRATSLGELAPPLRAHEIISPVISKTR